jgi:peroxiredoxin
MIRRWPFVTVAFALTLLCCGCGQNGSGDSWKVKTGDPVPSLALTATDGTSHNLADKKGKVVLVAIFATWCGPCRQELPELDAELYKRFKDKGLLVYAVNAGEDKATVDGFAKSSGLSFPLLIDEQSQLSEALGGSFLPRGILIDKDGKIQDRFVGYDPDKIKTELPKKIEALLK